MEESYNNRIVVGIDLGTTKSCVSCYKNGVVSVLKNKEGERITPSYIFFKDADKIIVGQRAKYLTDLDPECNNKVITTQDQHTYILRKIKIDLEQTLGEVIDKVVIAVPTHFNNKQRLSVLKSASAAGFTVLKLLNEPTAAALSYYYESNCNTEDYSLIFDFGGATCNVTILRKVENNIEITCKEDTHLGGQNFDDVINDYVRDLVLKKHGSFPELNQNCIRKIKNKCEEAKKRLSTTRETVIMFDAFADTGDIYEIPLTRKKLEIITADILERAMDILDRCVKSSKLSKDSIRNIILAGGSSRIPKIQAMISNYFNRKPINRFINPEECVAEGAALQAAIIVEP